MARVRRPHLLASAAMALCFAGSAAAQSTGETPAPPAGIAPAPLGTDQSQVPAPVPAADTPEPSGGIEDIVVTAQKREQNLQAVPVSISAVGEAAIIANKILDVADLSRIAPNLTVREGAGGTKIPQYAMRGIYTQGSAPAADKGIALYIDGVYIQNAAGSIFEFADVQRIEVLRGPQGTLFGRNSTGGAISVITREPTGEFGVRQDLTYGNLGRLRSKTRIDLPQAGPLSVSASYLHSERNGEIRNLGAGTTWDHTLSSDGRFGLVRSPRRLGDENVEGVFIAAKLDLHPDLDIGYKFDYSENDYTATGVGATYLPGAAAFAFGGFAPPVGTQVGGASGAAANAALARYLEQNPALRTPITKLRPDAVNNAFTQPGRSTAFGHNLTAQWKIAPGLSVKNILAFRHAKLFTSGFELSGLGGLLGQSAGGQGGVPAVPANGFTGAFGAPTSAAAAFPVLLIGTNGGNDQKQWSNEFQVNYDSDRLTLTAGFIHFHDRQITAGYASEFTTLQFAPLVGQGTTAAGTPYVIPRNTGFAPARTRTTSDALFVQPELHLTDTLDLVAGYRLTWDRKDGTEFVPGSAFPFSPSLGRNASIRYRDRRSTYLAGVNYRPNSNLLLYGKYVTGYISGGQLATIQYDPETARSFELGAKTDWLDRRLRSNLSLFHVDYGNIQQVTLGTLTGVASAANYASAIVSLADATAKGFEWENTVVPIDGLTFQADVGYTDFAFRTASAFPGFVFQSGQGGIVDGFRPKWTVNLSGQYEVRDVVAGGSLLLRTDASYKSAAIQGTDITPGNGPSARVDPAYVDALTIPGSWIVNGRIALQGFDLAGTRATLGIFGKNILDNRNPVQLTALAFAVSAIYERARTYGVDLSFEF